MNVLARYNHKTQAVKLLFSSSDGWGLPVWHGPCPGRGAARRLSGVVRCDRTDLEVGRRSGPREGSDAIPQLVVPAYATHNHRC
jgi:hypothetical protein